MSMTFGVDLNPDGDNTRSLGSSSARWKVNGHVSELLEVLITASNNTSITISDSRITADHVVVNQLLEIASDVSYTTAAGSLTLSCSSGIPAMTLYLGVKVA